MSLTSRERYSESPRGQAMNTLCRAKRREKLDVPDSQKERLLAEHATGRCFGPRHVHGPVVTVRAGAGGQWRWMCRLCAKVFDGHVRVMERARRSSSG